MSVEVGVRLGLGREVGLCLGNWGGKGEERKWWRLS